MKLFSEYKMLSLKKRLRLKNIVHNAAPPSSLNVAKKHENSSLFFFYNFEDQISLYMWKTMTKVSFAWSDSLRKGHQFKNLCYKIIYAV